MTAEMPTVMSNAKSESSWTLMMNGELVKAIPVASPKYTCRITTSDGVLSVFSEEEEMGKRIVQVFIVDSDKDVPLEHSLLYRGDEKMTDSTNQELFFEVPIKELLDKHNEMRTTLKDEGGDELRPARIRDLTMTVVEIAKF